MEEVTLEVTSVRTMRSDQGASSCYRTEETPHAYGDDRYQLFSNVVDMDMTAMEESGLADADLISVPEAARHIGLHVDTLYRLCRTGRFPPAFQIGARWKVSVPRLARYLHGDMTEP